jgi:hypothetical protein
VILSKGMYPIVAVSCTYKLPPYRTGNSSMLLTEDTSLLRTA